MRMRLPSCWWPASDDASPLTPSSRSPSLAIDVDLVVERALAGGGVGVEQAALAPGRHRHADGVGHALAQRAGGGLDAGGVAVLGVARRAAAPDAQRLEVVEGEAEAAEVQLDVERQARVTRAQHEAVAPDPGRVGGVVPHRLLEEQVRRGRQAHRRAGVAVADLLDGVHGQGAHGVDGPTVEIGPVEPGAERAAGAGHEGPLRRRGASYTGRPVVPRRSGAEPAPPWRAYPGGRGTTHSAGPPLGPPSGVGSQRRRTRSGLDSRVPQDPTDPRTS